MRGLLIVATSLVFTVAGFVLGMVEGRTRTYQDLLKPGLSSYCREFHVFEEYKINHCWEIREVNIMEHADDE